MPAHTPPIAGYQGFIRVTVHEERNGTSGFGGPDTNTFWYAGPKMAMMK
ncbi:MAG: hypothetical protein ACI8Z1_002265 [Candidatus Azotimanducaceae bacterium]|jgi:hypothetical protein